MLVFLMHACVLLFGLFYTFRPTFLTGFASMQTDPGDTVLNHYFLEHLWCCLTRPDYVGTVWSPGFFAPHPNILAYSDNLFGTAPLYFLVRPLVEAPLAFQLWLLLLAVMNYASVVIVLGRFGCRPVLTAVGGLLFAFGLPYVQQLNHPQLLPRCAMPFAVWYLSSFVETPRRTTFAKGVGCVVWQILAGVYLGWFLCFGLGVWFGLSMTRRANRERVLSFAWEYPLSIAAIVVAAGGGLTPVLLPYLEVNRGFERTFAECLYQTPHWRSWLSAPAGTLWHYPLKPLMGRPHPTEGYIFGGFVLYGLLLLGLLRGTASGERKHADGGRKHTAREESSASALLFTAIILMSLAFAVGDLSAWRGVWEVVPGAKAIRAVSRIFTIINLFIILGGLLAVERLLRSCSDGCAVTVAVLLLIAAAVENCRWGSAHSDRSFKVANFYGRASDWAERIRGADYARINDPGLSWDYDEHEMCAMWAGLIANVRMVNGYSGRVPNGYPGVFRGVSVVGSRREQRILTETKVRAVLGHALRDRRVIVVTPRAGQGR